MTSNQGDAYPMSFVSTSLVPSRRFRRAAAGLALPVALAMAVAFGGAAGALPTFELRPATPESPNAVPPLPDLGTFPVQLVLDDDSAEGSVGVTSGPQAKQFLWFNQFTSGQPFHLEEVWVLFPVDPVLAVGAAIELVVYEDADSDPTNGATLRLAWASTVQAADGNTFSIYPLGAPLSFSGSGDVLIGVVPRFITSGVTPPTFPAALDTGGDAGASWLAVWTADPPAPPALPADGVMVLTGAVLPGGGNWMIRGFGSNASTLEIPTLGFAGLAALAALLGAASMLRLRRRKA